MNVMAYKIECLTNLHVGSGDLNYNIIDNEVERDAVTGYPIIHASGLKGALKEHFKKKEDPQFILDVFGQEPSDDKIQAGSYKFLDAYLLARPMRVSGAIASIMVVSEKSVNDFIRRMNAFGITKFGTEELHVEFPEDVSFLTNVDNISVEAEPTGTLPDAAKDVLKGSCRKKRSGGHLPEPGLCSHKSPAARSGKFPSAERRRKQIPLVRGGSAARQCVLYDDPLSGEG